MAHYGAHWAKIARACALSLVCAACQGGYPIAPTRCDELCNEGATQLPCQDEDPAGCVLFCQKLGGDALGCDTEFDALLACWQRTPPEQRACGSQRDGSACVNETNAYIGCSGSFSSYGPTGGPAF